MRRLLPLLLLAVASAGHAQGTALDPNAVVATVNGEPIKASDYFRRLEWYQVNPQSPFAKANLPVGFQLLRQMISERMILQLAKSRNVAPTGPEIDARVADVYRTSPTLKAQLVDSGRGEDDLRTEMAYEEAQFKLVTAGVTITDQEVEKRYKDLPSQFEEPARYKLRVIAVGDDAAQKTVDDALKAGKPFVDVAKQYSADERTRTSGGDYGEVRDNGIPDAIRAAIVATPAGGSSAWVKTESGARLRFFVERVTPARKIPLDADVKARIRRGMMLERGRTKNDVTKALDDATRAAKVTIAQPQFQKYYAELQQNAVSTPSAG